jgi:hypothetical protein
MSTVDDAEVIAAQIGRPSRADPDVVARCHLGLPVVVRMPPLLDDGTPFPTRYWLTCPLAVTRIGRLEGAGGVRSMERWLGADPDLASRLDAAHERYATDRDAGLADGTGPRPVGGIAGTLGDGVKCLHAHYADHAAGNDNPVGEAVAPWTEPLDCVATCVADGSRNPAWREPK